MKVVEGHVAWPEAARPAGRRALPAGGRSPRWPAR